MASLVRILVYGSPGFRSVREFAFAVSRVCFRLRSWSVFKLLVIFLKIPLFSPFSGPDLASAPNPALPHSLVKKRESSWKASSSRLFPRSHCFNYKRTSLLQLPVWKFIYQLNEKIESLSECITVTMAEVNCGAETMFRDSIASASSLMNYQAKCVIRVIRTYY